MAQMMVISVRLARHPAQSLRPFMTLPPCPRPFMGTEVKQVLDWPSGGT